MRCSSFYCFSGAGSKLWCVAHITLFIWYEKFRRCVISPSDPQRQISKRILLVFFHNTRVILFLLPWCDAGWCFPCRNLTRPQVIDVDQSAQVGALSQPSLLQLPLFATSPSSSSAPTWAASLLLTASANSKTISGVAKTTERMIYSLLILKTSVLSRRFVWALLSDF